jgi:hypothetical protein
MIDYFILLTPLIVLPILLLFAFVGCAFHSSGLGWAPKVIVHPDALTHKNAKSLKITITGKATKGGVFFNCTIKKTVDSWTKTDSEMTVAIDWTDDVPSDPNADHEFTATCKVDIFDHQGDLIDSVEKTQPNISTDGIEDITFELLPTIDNVSDGFSLEYQS